MKTKLEEKDLDSLLEKALASSHEFASWFLSFTKFSDQQAKYLWSRSNYPWGEFPFPLINPETGIEEMHVRGGETDVLVVFETKSEERFALHIENKITSQFTEYQPEMYLARAAHWMGLEKYKNYTDYQSVLVAPTAFFNRYIEDAVKFNCYISYEQIADYVPEFDLNG